MQSSYIPWKGYFDLINMVDEFVLLDDVQFTRRDWRNRNRIKTGNGAAWLTIPVRTRGRRTQRIDETLISDPSWATTHWSTLNQAYARAPHLESYRKLFARLYEECGSEKHLSIVNRRFIETVCDLLGITSTISWSTDYEPTGAKTERLLSLCRQAGATRYLSGPTAKAYLDESAFERSGIELTYMDYAGYRPYPQLHPPFEHHVSIVDLIFNTGPDATRHMKSFGG